MKDLSTHTHIRQLSTKEVTCRAINKEPTTAKEGNELNHEGVHDNALTAREEEHAHEQNGLSVIGRKGQGREPREDTDHELEGTDEPRHRPGGQ